MPVHISGLKRILDFRFLIVTANSFLVDTQGWGTLSLSKRAGASFDTPAVSGRLPLVSMKTERALDLIGNKAAPIYFPQMTQISADFICVICDICGKAYNR